MLYLTIVTPKTTSPPKVAFIILCWNNRDLLQECFESIKAQTYSNFVTVMVDNGSADDSVAFTKANYPEVTVIETGENLGFAIGNNRGIAYALDELQSDYVALINTDATIAKDWLERLVSFALTRPKGASFQSPTLDYYDHAFLDSRGIKINHNGQAEQMGHRETDFKTNLATKRVFGVNAAAALFSGTFLKVQPFGSQYLDEDMWMYLEDIDLAARAVIMGWENWLVNESAAYHMGSASSGKNPGFSVYMVYRNNLSLHIKNLPTSILLRIMPGLIYTDLLSVYRLTRGRNYRAAKSLIKGRFFGLGRVPLFMKKRKTLKKLRTISNKELWDLMA